MDSGGQPGNQNAAKAKRWQKALERALARAGGEVDMGLDGIADKVVAAAQTGDVAAWKEIGDRMDGKPSQAIVGDPEQPLIHRIERVIIDNTASGNA